MKRALHLTALVVALLAAGDVRAQGVERLPSGARVRVWIPDSLRQEPYMPRRRSIIGTLARATPDTLWLHVAGPDTLRLPRVSMAVEVSRGASRTRSAVEHGLVMGIALGLIFYAAADDDAESRREAVQKGGIAAAIGAVIGAWRPYERWRGVR